MRIGIVSDTHNNLKSVGQIVQLFNDAGVEHVIHTGDISQAKTIHHFEGLEAPLSGVFGNNDQGELESLNVAVAQQGFQFVQPPLTLLWAERRIVVVHDPQELEQINVSCYDVVLHGHTHMRRIEFEAGRLTFNPGECAGMMKGLNAVGVLDLELMTPEILTF